MIEDNLTEGPAAQVPKGKPGIMPLVVVAIVVIAAVGGMFAYNAYLKPDLAPGEVRLTLSIDYGNGTLEWHNVTTTKNSMTGLLSEAMGSGNFKLNKSVEGVAYMESIRGVKNNGTVAGISDAPVRWWRYSINGTEAPSTDMTFDSKHSLAPLKHEQRISFAFKVSDGPSGIIDKAGISVSVKLNFGNGTTRQEIVVTDNYTAMGALEAMVGYQNLDVQDFGWGFFVNGIEGVKAGAKVEGMGDTSNYYWAFYVNDAYAMVGASQYVLQDGDVMEWRFETF